MLKIYAAEYVYVYVCDQAQESKESFREDPQRFEKVGKMHGKANRLVKDSVIRFFTGKLSPQVRCALRSTVASCKFARYIQVVKINVKDSYKKHIGEKNILIYNISKFTICS